MSILCLWIILGLICYSRCASNSTFFSAEVIDYIISDDDTGDTCKGPNLVGVEWVLSKRNSEYGWGEQTHRAMVILELNDYGSSAGKHKDILMMQHQLEVELTRALLWNATDPSSPLRVSELSLYIQALLAMGRNPKEFYGVDLVEKLLSLVDKQDSPHPFSVLILCSAGAAEERHLRGIRNKLRLSKLPSNRDKGHAAMALKAFVCTLEKDCSEFSALKSEMDIAAKTLARLQKADGSFGDVYTTSLVVQALITYEYDQHWNKQKALDFLRSKQREYVNMISTYYIELALHAPKGLFKSVMQHLNRTTKEGFPTVEELQRWPRQFYVQYSIKVGAHPNFYNSITIKVPSNVTFFDVMRLAAYENALFNFSYHLNYKKDLVVFSLCGIPNDAEDGLYWRLVLEQDVDHNRHVSTLRELTKSPKDIKPIKDSHFIYWYQDIDEKIRGVVY